MRKTFPSFLSFLLILIVVSVAAASASAQGNRTVLLLLGKWDETPEACAVLADNVRRSKIPAVLIGDRVWRECPLTLKAVKSVPNLYLGAHVVPGNWPVGTTKESMVQLARERFARGPYKGPQFVYCDGCEWIWRQGTDAADSRRRVREYVDALASLARESNIAPIIGASAGPEYVGDILTSLGSRDQGVQDPLVYFRTRVDAAVAGRSAGMFPAWMRWDAGWIGELSGDDWKTLPLSTYAAIWQMAEDADVGITYRTSCERMARADAASLAALDLIAEMEARRARRRELMTAKTPVPDPQPEPAPPAPPVPPAQTNKIEVRTTIQIRDALAAAKPGDTILLRGGRYETPADARGWNYRAAIEVNVSGESGKPIAIAAYPGEKPLIDGLGNTYAIRIGQQQLDGTLSPVHDIIVDGLEVTGGKTGIMLLRSKDVTIRNCSVHDNGDGGEKPGVQLWGQCENVVIERCRIYANSNGLQGYEEPGETGTMGAMNCVYRDNFIYANHRTSNPGNSSGCEFRFGVCCTIKGNIIYDNPDAGINGLGNVMCRVTDNAVLNNWGGGNQEGIKICVRGGGANLIANNIAAWNGARGWDAASGIGDLCVNNIFYGNDSWGVLAQGAESMLFGNVLAGNSVIGEWNGPNEFKEMDGGGFSSISDYNWIAGSSAYQRLGLVLPPNTKTGDPGLRPALKMRRDRPDQVFHPEEVFGTGDIDAARRKVVEAFALGAGDPAVPIADAIQRANANIPRVMAAIDQAIARESQSPAFQAKQAVICWKKIKVMLTSY